MHKTKAKHAPCTLLTYESKQKGQAKQIYQFMLKQAKKNLVLVVRHTHKQKSRE